MNRPPQRRGSYSPDLRAFMDDLDARGLSDPIVAKRASWQDLLTLAGLGLVSTSTMEVREDIWRLRLTRAGNAVRSLLLAERARA